MIIPRPLSQGSRVALIAPSGPVKPERLGPAVQSVRDMGLDPVVYPSCAMTHGYLAGLDEARARDVNAAFADNSVEGIICIRGGYGAHRLMSLIDWNTVKCHPKRLFGYSDVTALHLELNGRCGMVSFHTPMPATEWYQGLDKYTLDSLQEALFGPLPQGLENPADSPLVALSGGRASGRLVGGNLSLVVSTLGTSYEVDTAGKILFLEDVREEPYKVDRMLLQLRDAGKLDGCGGIILGAFTDTQVEEGKSTLTLEEVFDELLPKDKPVVSGFQCGHLLPTLSLPLGVPVCLDADSGKITMMGE